MIRENQSYLNNLRVALDIIVAWLSFALAYFIRFKLIGGVLSISLRELLLPIAIIIPIIWILYYLFDLYSPLRVKSIHKEVMSIMKANLLAYLIFFVALYLFNEPNYSRWLVTIFFIINTMAASAMRAVIKNILHKYRKSGYNLKHCIVIGTTPTASDFITKIKHNAYWGYNICGIVEATYFEKPIITAALAGEIDLSTKYANAFAGYSVLGHVSNLEEILNNNDIDIIFIALEGEHQVYLKKILYVCEKSGVKTNIIPYYHRYVPAKPYMDDLDGLPVIDVRHVPLDNIFKWFVKRFFDIVLSIIIIILISPVLIFSAIMIKLSSKGPILFKQERVGLDRKPFQMYKFRSMRVQSAETEKSQWTTKNDPRKTAWGSFMRKTSIDELPQFFNVLKGDMSIVGPRPERPYFVDKFKEEIPRYMIKHQVRPGITGWAQVNGLRGDTSIEERIAYDLYYIENWEFLFDVKIIFLTIFKGFINKNAY
ncbi:MAG: undecaprenyl-phosphate glucose phosphotransferase [Epulopiscium sp. Nuni2H_MBin001]|nr:MAG: undecaprenyl-phosphate glucose phosphotransferase [Epulopiscium sp. Nuni2H_MBin001]